MVSGVGATLSTGEPPPQAPRSASGARMINRFMSVSCSVERRQRRSQLAPELELRWKTVLARTRHE
jgi:hypothetical protein